VRFEPPNQNDGLPFVLQFSGELYSFLAQKQARARTEALFMVVENKGSDSHAQYVRAVKIPNTRLISYTVVRNAVECSKILGRASGARRV